MDLLKPLMRFTSVLTCLTLTLACSTTTIHLNTLYLNDEKSQKVKVALLEQGFDVEFNELSFPSNIYSTSILYSPFVKTVGAIDTLENTLNSLGYDVGSINALVASNHWYTKNTIGVFIVPEGITPNSGKNTEDIAFKYQSEGCDTNTVLNLRRDGKFTYMPLGKLEITGTWSITQYPYILLNSDEPYLNFYYEITRSKKVDRISVVDIIELQPLDSSLIISKCKMTYGVREVS